jgi:hypothetical protein
VLICEDIDIFNSEAAYTSADLLRFCGVPLGVHFFQGQVLNVAPLHSRVVFHGGKPLLKFCACTAESLLGVDFQEA